MLWPKLTSDYGLCYFSGTPIKNKRMSFVSLFAFGKELIIINDSLIIISVMLLLLTLIIKYAGHIVTAAFDNARVTTQKDFGLLIKDMLKISTAYRDKLEFVLELNIHRGKLLPDFSSYLEESDNPENNIKEDNMVHN
jgi:hypothetical protein